MRLPKNVWDDIVQSAAVRAAILKKAAKLADEARTRAAQDRVATEITITQGTRPEGRSYARVTSSNGAAEHGTSWTTRSRILGRTIYGEGPL